MSLVAFETVLSCVMVVLAGISCGPEGIRLSSPTGTPALGGEEPRSQLEEALSLVPLEFADSPVEFADYSSYLELRGRGEVPWPYEGMRLHRDLKSHVVTLDELLGLDVLSSDFGIWTWEPGNTSPKFYASRGGFEGETVARGLLEIGYEERDYYGNLYYALGDGFAWSIQHPLGATGVSLNRVAVIGAWLLAAPSTGILARLIDLHKWGQQPSLLDSEPHRALLDAVGLRAVGGAFFSPEWVAENWNTVNTGPVERLDRYLTGPGQWGQLSAYTLAFMGYRIRGDADETVVALYYPEPGAAALDARELERRWNSFHYNAFGAGLINAPEQEDVPLTRSCAPFSATPLLKPGYSVLVGTCPAIRSEEYDPATKGPGLWTWLFGSRELEFLANDLSELKSLGQQ